MNQPKYLNKREIIEDKKEKKKYYFSKVISSDTFRSNKVTIKIAIILQISKDMKDQR